MYKESYKSLQCVSIKYEFICALHPSVSLPLTADDTLDRCESDEEDDCDWLPASLEHIHYSDNNFPSKAHCIARW